MDNHLYSFIIWEQSRNKSEEIINDITSKFIIREIFEIFWNKKNFLNNLIRFYGHSLPDPKKKTLLCGTGPFLLIIVQDRNPNFRTGIVFNGKITINDNIAKNKMIMEDKYIFLKALRKSTYEKKQVLEKKVIYMSDRISKKILHIKHMVQEYRDLRRNKAKIDTKSLKKKIKELRISINNDWQSWTRLKKEVSSHATLYHHH